MSKEGDLPREILTGSEDPRTDDTLLPLARSSGVTSCVLAHHGGGRKQTATTLGIGTNTLWRKVRAYGGHR